MKREKKIRSKVWSVQFWDQGKEYEPVEVVMSRPVTEIDVLMYAIRKASIEQTGGHGFSLGVKYIAKPVRNRTCTRFGNGHKKG